jgi:hypothetical protein
VHFHFSAGQPEAQHLPSLVARLGGNWEWRMREADMSEGLARDLKELNELYSR